MTTYLWRNDMLLVKHCFRASGNCCELCGGHRSECYHGRTDWVHTGEPNIIFHWNELWPRLTHFLSQIVPPISFRNVRISESRPSSTPLTHCVSFHVLYKDESHLSLFLTWKNMKRNACTRWIVIKTNQEFNSKLNGLINIQYANKWK